MLKSITSSSASFLGRFVFHDSHFHGSTCGSLLSREINSLSRSCERAGTTSLGRITLKGATTSNSPQQKRPLHVYAIGCPDDSRIVTPLWQQTFSRSLAATPRRRRQGQQNKNNQNKKILSNEDLIASLMRSSNESSVDKVTVRLVIDEGPTDESTVKVTTLAEAIELSLDRDVDLIGISLEKDPPVIKAAELAKLEYKAQQAQKKQQQQAAANRKETKSMRFKAGIDSNDLDRKVAQLTGYLQKGNDCEYTVFTKGRLLRDNPDAGIELVERIQALIADYAVLKRSPETNETKSFYRVKLEAKKQKN